MSEMEEKLENILGSPQAMSQSMSLAQSVNRGGPGPSSPEQNQNQAQPQNQAAEQASSPTPPPQSGDAPAPAPPPPPAAPSGLGNLSGMLGALGNLDAGTLSAAASLIGQFTDDGDDKRTALLAALRPYVREERYAKLDKAIQIAKLSRLIRSGLDLLRARKEDGHV